MTRFVFEGILSTVTEDGGAAKIGELHSSSNDGLFVRIQSWDSDLLHHDFTMIADKHIKVTIETIDE